MIAAFALLLQKPDTYTGGRVSVEPVFLIPTGQKAPAEADGAAFEKHLKIAQARFLEMLRKEDTFKVVDNVRTFECPISVDDLKAKPDGGAEYVVNQLLKKDGYTRWNCPFIYVVLTVGTGDADEDIARPINGGHNNGGGIVILNADALTKSPYFQSTLQHELGHAFGLPHVEEFGYDMNSNDSIMSLSPAHHSNFFEPSKTPGILIAEDLRELGDNKWVFPDYKFDRNIDCPAGYVMQPDAPYDPMDLSGSD